MLTPARICLIYTGGTVGMVPGPAGYRDDLRFGPLLKDTLRAVLPVAAEHIDVVEPPPPIDSANADPSLWIRLAESIADRYQQYDAFVVLHGTDTMAFTASALSFMLGGLAKPVVLTGAQVPLGESRSDAVGNLTGAIDLATRRTVREVCVYFAGRVLRGNRCTKYASRELDAFRSPNFGELCSGEEDAPASPAGTGPATLEPVIPRREAAVAVVDLHPALTPRQLDRVLDPSLAGVVMRCYGVGNGPAGRPGMTEVIERACADGTVLVAVSQCAVGGVEMASYASGSGLAGAGVVDGGDLTTEAALAKLWFLAGTGASPDAIRRLMRTPLRGEMQPVGTGSPG